MERQDEDTFNRFEVLDDLGQQEVNPGLLSVDLGVVGSSLEDHTSITPPAPQEGSAIPMVTDVQVGAQVMSSPNVELGQGDGSTSFSAQNVGSDVAKSSKPSPQLGILQKDGKKGGSEKSVKLGRKKYLGKIKMMGETLVESRSIKTLDSHFLTPLK